MADLRRNLFVIAPRGSALALVIVIAALSVAILSEFRPTLEVLAPPSLGVTSAIFDALLRASVLGAVAATAWAVYRLMNVWNCLRSFLGDIASSRLVQSMTTLPRDLLRVGSLSLIDSPARHQVAEVSNELWSDLCGAWERKRGSARAWNPELARGIDGVTTALDWRPDGPVSTAERAERLVGAQLLLEQVWERYPEPAGATASGNIPAPFRSWRDQAERFLSVQTVEYIEWAQQHLRRLAVFLLVSMLLTTMLMSTYPFQPLNLVKLVFTIIMVIAMACLVLVVTQMNRDPVLSAITGSDPGRITWNAGYFLNLVLFAALPLLALVSAEYVTVRTALFSWMQPLLQAFTKF